MSAHASLLLSASRVFPRRSGTHRLGESGKAWLSGMLLAVAALGGAVFSAHAQSDLRPLVAPTPTPKPGGFFFFRPQPQRPVAESIAPRQEGPKISARLDAVNPDTTSVIVSLSRQRVYVMSNGETIIDSPVSSGKRGHSTPTGTFRIKEKEINHFSNIYGNFVDRTGRVVRSGISSKIDSAPSGTHYEGAPMRFFMRLTDGGVGMHIGILPGYPASHGCIRLPTDVAPLIYKSVKIGTQVTVQD